MWANRRVAWSSPSASMKIAAFSGPDRPRISSRMRGDANSMSSLRFLIDPATEDRDRLGRMLLDDFADFPDRESAHAAFYLGDVDHAVVLFALCVRESLSQCRSGRSGKLGYALARACEKRLLTVGLRLELSAREQPCHERTHDQQQDEHGDDRNQRDFGEMHDVVLAESEQRRLGRDRAELARFLHELHVGDINGIA